MSSQRTKILHEIASNYRKSEVSIRKSQTSNQQIDHEHLTIAHHRNSSVHQDLDAEVGVFGLPRSPPCERFRRTSASDAR